MLFSNFQEASARGERAWAGVVAASEFVLFLTANLFFKRKSKCVNWTKWVGSNF